MSDSTEEVSKVLTRKKAKEQYEKECMNMQFSTLGDVFSPEAKKMAVQSLEDKIEAAKVWRTRNPDKAKKFVEELERYVTVAPIHAALLGPIAERYGVPKPVSQVIRLYPQFKLFSAADSLVKSPALSLASRSGDPAYWVKFRRKSPDGITGAADFDPWTTLGVPNSDRPFGEVRVDIFESFMFASYGAGTMKDLAGVCSTFKRCSGVSFQSFFSSLRPAEVQRHPLAANRFTWSWTNDEPPCLYCAAKRPPYPLGDDIDSDPTIVGELMPLASTRLPEYIDFKDIAERKSVPLAVVHVSYLAALRQALRMKIDAKTEAQAFPRIDRELARDLYAEARKGLEIYTSVLRKIERLFPELAK